MKNVIAFGLVLLAAVCLCKGDAMPPNTSRGGRSSQMGRGSWVQGQPGRVMGGSGKMGHLGNIQGQGQWKSGQGQGQWQQQSGQQGRGIGGMMDGQGGRNWQQGQGKIIG